MKNKVRYIALETSARIVLGLVLGTRLRLGLEPVLVFGCGTSSGLHLGVGAVLIVGISFRFRLEMDSATVTFMDRDGSGLRSGIGIKLGLCLGTGLWLGRGKELGLDLGTLLE